MCILFVVAGPEHQGQRTDSIIGGGIFLTVCSDHLTVCCDLIFVCVCTKWSAVIHLQVVWPDYPPLLVSSSPWHLTCFKTLSGQNSKTDVSAFVLTLFLFKICQ